MDNSWEGMVIEEILRQLTCPGRSFDYYYRISGGTSDAPNSDAWGGAARAWRSLISGLWSAGGFG